MKMRQLPRFLTEPDPSLYKTGKYLVLDFETTNIEHGSALNKDNRLVLSAWCVDGQMYYDWGGELEQEKLVRACNEADFLIAHNAKFELQWLERCGYDIGSRPVYCTMVAEWVIAGNRKWPLNLEACADRYSLGHKDSVVSGLISAGVCPSDIPRSLLLKYGLMDVTLTERLFRKQMQLMEDTRLLPVVYTRCLATPVLADMEKNGLHLDAARVEKEYDETLTRYTKVMAELDRIAEGVNPKSPQQVAEFVYGKLGFEELKDRKGQPIRNAPNKRFPGGQPRTDEATLLSLNVSTPEQERFLELKKEQAQLSAALDKNLSMFVGACREHDCMIYGELVQGRTVTHRLASAGRRTYYRMFDAYKGCQFQNLPRAYKPLFSARKEGWLVGGLD